MGDRGSPSGTPISKLGTPGGTRLCNGRRVESARSFTVEEKVTLIVQMALLSAFGSKSAAFHTTATTTRHKTKHGEEDCNYSGLGPCLADQGQ